MQMRTLGIPGIPVSPIMLGGNVFGWTTDEATSFAVLDRFVEGTAEELAMAGALPVE